MPFKLSPYVNVLEDTRDQYKPSDRGLLHRLTGECPKIPRLVAELLLAEKWQDIPSTLLTQLQQRGFLIREGSDQTDRSNLLKNWENHFLMIPIHNPSIYLLKDKNPTIYRIKDLGKCYLPRTEQTPTLVKESICEIGVKLLAAGQNNISLKQFVINCNYGEADIIDALEFLVDVNRQLLRLVSDIDVVNQSKHSAHYVMQSFYSSGSTSSALNYYDHEVKEAQWNFDWVETTVSHSFRETSLVFNGLTYAASLLKAVIGLGVNVREANILEVGGGVGFFGCSFLTACRDQFENLPNYSILDLSPTLIESQQQLANNHGVKINSIIGDAQEWCPSEKYDLIVSNEVIADFAVEYQNGKIVHIGAQNVIKKIAGALSSNGVAVIIEYGSLSESSARVEHLNHDEYSIDFAALLSFAELNGFEAECIPLADFLNLQLDQSLLVGQHEKYFCLAKCLSDFAFDLDYRAYDEIEFQRLFGNLIKTEKIGGLSFKPAREGMHFGPDTKQFYAMVLKHSETN